MSLPPFPLFPGLPGGPELLVLLVIVLVLFGLPVLLLVGGVAWFGSGDSSDERIAELERRIDELERERGDAARAPRTAETRSDDRD